jgi:hypothetical protein
MKDISRKEIAKELPKATILNELEEFFDDFNGYNNLFDEIVSIGNQFALFKNEEMNFEQTNEVQNNFFDFWKF